MSAEKCGTKAGYESHKYYGEKPCDACREASRLYQREWRARKGAPQTRSRILPRVHAAALWRLKALHPDEFALLVEDEWRVEAARARAAS